MKYIIKSNEPDSFVNWKIRKRLTQSDLERKTRIQDEYKELWEKFKKDREGKSARNEVKESILIEQGYICCYCQRGLEGNKIASSPMVLEHFIPKSIEPIRMYNYDNILGCCDGGKEIKDTYTDDEGIETIPKWCEYAKGSQLLSINPLDINCEAHFDYYLVPTTSTEWEVFVEGKTPEGKETIDVLQLNIPHLRRLRANAIVPLITTAEGDFIDENDKQGLLSVLLNRTHNMFLPFIVVIKNLLDRI